MKYSQIKVFYKYLIFSFFSIACISLLLGLYIYLKTKAPFANNDPVIPNIVIKQKKPINKIFCKAWNSKTYIKTPPISNISNKIQVRVFKSHPLLKHACNLELILENTYKKRIKPNQKIYLGYDNKSHKYVFLEKSNFHIKLAKNKIYTFAEYRENQELKTKKGSFKINYQKPEKMPLQNTKDIVLLKQAIFLSPNLFLQKYENENQKSSRLYFKDQNCEIFINKSDLLTFENEKWVIAKKPKKENPIAKVLSINKRSITLDVWQKNTPYSAEITLFQNNIDSKIQTKPDFISSICIRTKKQISCLIENQRMIIREKDILFKKDRRWKIERLSNYKKEGKEIFVFDEIKDKKLITGYLFSKDRTSSARIEKSITNKTVNNFLHKKRK